MARPTKACRQCSKRFLPQRATARFCGDACRKAASRARMASAEASVTLRQSEIPDSVTEAPTDTQPTMSGRPFTLEGDTIHGRKWKVTDGWLRCEANGMVEGGWKPVFAVADVADLNAAIAWLSGAQLVAASEQEAA
jgi:hypothetical protein